MTAKAKRSNPNPICDSCGHPRSKHRPPVYITAPLCRQRSLISGRLCRCNGYAKPPAAKEAPGA